MKNYNRTKTTASRTFSIIFLPPSIKNKQNLHFPKISKTKPTWMKIIAVCWIGASFHRLFTRCTILARIKTWLKQLKRASNSKRALRDTGQGEWSFCCIRMSLFWRMTEWGRRRVWRSWNGSLRFSRKCLRSMSCPTMK